MPIQQHINLSERIMANLRFLHPSRHSLEIVTSTAPNGSGTAYVVDTQSVYPHTDESKWLLMKQETESNELGNALRDLLEQTKKLVAEEIEARKTGLRAPNGDHRVE